MINLLTKARWLEKLDPKRGGDLALLSCCVVTGVLDCAAFNNWGVFVGMQTGNTVILCLSTAGFPAEQPWAYASTIISIVAFFLGAIFTTRLSIALGPLKRIVLVANILLQGFLILVVAALAMVSIVITDNNYDLTSTAPSPPPPPPPQQQEERRIAVLSDVRILIGIAPLAFQSGATIATSRLLGYGQEIPVVVYTSTYAALAGDMKLFKLRNNKPRNQRLLAVICVLVGAFCAAWIQKRSVGMVACLWLGAGVKILLALAIALFMSSQKRNEGP